MTNIPKNTSDKKGPADHYITLQGATDTFGYIGALCGSISAGYAAYIILADKVVDHLAVGGGVAAGGLAGTLGFLAMYKLSKYFEKKHDAIKKTNRNTTNFEEEKKRGEEWKRNNLLP